MGKPSVTEFKVLQRQEHHCLLELRPITGRTHQLRVHCAHMGFPVLGDPQYGSQASQTFSHSLGLETQMLCAHRLEFAHPVSGQPMCLQSKMDVSL